ncbi:hypothetical protein ASF71_18865 [Deinococcus sp. Leaf326]|nr:hypothetical protein ASF71_18865 [Deinococcus sp. Leaf326]
MRLQVTVVMKQAVDQERESRIVLSCSCGLKVECFLREALLPDEAFFFGFLEGGAHVSWTFVTHQGVEGSLDQFVLLVVSGLEGGHRVSGRIQMQQGVMVVDGSNQRRNSFGAGGKRKGMRWGRSITLQGPLPAEDVAMFQGEQGGLCGDEEPMEDTRLFLNAFPRLMHRDIGAVPAGQGSHRDAWSVVPDPGERVRTVLVKDTLEEGAVLRGVPPYPVGGSVLAAARAGPSLHDFWQVGRPQDRGKTRWVEQCLFLSFRALGHGRS